MAKCADVLPCGARIPAGTRVMFNPYSFNRNPANFSDPDSFLPSRWMEDGAKCRRYDMQGFTYPAFNAGPRVCLGRNMAMLEAKVVLSHVIPDFDVDLSPGFEPQQRFTVVLASMNGLSLTARPRGH